MSVLYIHIPFCKQACHYCNFHFSTSLKYRKEMLDAIILEMELRKDYLPEDSLQTIYFGGGTPSLLNLSELELIFEHIQKHFTIAPDAEITLEANPDDLHLQKLKELWQSPINRLSIGIQSFIAKDLQFMNRAHSAKESITCLEHAKNVGFDNLSIDLIYGTPTLSDADWQKNITTIFDFQIPHISCYCLTVEPGTALDHFVKKGKAAAVNEEQAARQFEQLISAMKANGYLHYEISNFAKPGHFAQHNSNYWLGTSYLGLGPSAHSFNINSRQWNVANNAKYLKAIAENQVPFEKEILTPAQQYNEYVMTSLRTIWGCDLQKIGSFGTKVYEHFLKQIQIFVKEKKVVEKEGKYVLSTSGKLLADRIAMELFI